MKGSQHYREAERLLERAKELPGEAHVSSDLTLKAAQVHATLALAAATAYPAVLDYHGHEGADARDWTEATK